MIGEITFDIPLASESFQNTRPRHSGAPLGDVGVKWRHKASSWLALGVQILKVNGEPHCGHRTQSRVLCNMCTWGFQLRLLDCLHLTLAKIIGEPELKLPFQSEDPIRSTNSS